LRIGAEVQSIQRQIAIDCAVLQQDMTTPCAAGRRCYGEPYRRYIAYEVFVCEGCVYV
jgi:hypothetical protein